jgi:RimJ/RimL family protein N-acetyltransferase
MLSGMSTFAAPVRSTSLLAPVRLAGRFATLEPLAIEHADALLRAANESRRTYGFTIVPETMAEMETWIAFALSEQTAGLALPFVVRDGRGDVVGSTRFLSIEHWTFPGAPPEPVPAGPDVVEIGFTWYAERAQRTPLNTQAKLLLCTHAFETWRVRRVMWKTDARNARSRAAIERLGARLDGILRAHRPASDGGVRDSAFYSMLAAEWPAARARLAARLEAAANQFVAASSADNMSA